MTNSKLILDLDVNKTFVAEDGTIVRIISQFTENDADFAQGFRYRGHNGYSYAADGSVFGSVGGVLIEQVGASPLVREVVVPCIGSFYRNEIGGVVYIVGVVPNNHRLYKKGFRFIDQRGSYYTETGSVGSKMWASLNLAERIEQTEELAIEVLESFRNARARKVERVEKLTKIGRTFKKFTSLPVLGGIDIGLGYACCCLGAPVIGGLSIGTGIGAILLDEFYLNDTND